MNAQQEAAMQRCELAQRTGTTAKQERMHDTSTLIQIAIADKYHHDSKS